jgi:lambda family phage minor tail protein L
MKTLSAASVVEKNRLSSPYPWLILLEITFPAPTNTIYLVRNVDAITFKGQVYTPFPFEIEFGKETSAGDIPSVTLRVSNITRVIQYEVELADGLIDFDVVIHIVNSHYLADDYSDLDLNLQVMACSCDESWVTFILGLENPLNKRFPRYRYFRDYCNWKFKGVECGYNGPVDACRRNFSACQRIGNSTRFGGFRGLSATSIKYA